MLQKTELIEPDPLGIQALDILDLLKIRLRQL
jgi:hypothetical protein